MNKALFAAAFAAASLACAAAYADDATAAPGAVGGAVVGGAVGGPVGAVVGAGVGAIVGGALPPHPSVVYERPIVVGQVLPGDYEYYDVPNQPAYEYVILNHHRVIVDRRDRRVVRVID